MQRIWWIFIGFIVCVIGGVFLWFGGRDITLACSSKSWPTSMGTVTESKVRHSTSRSSRRSHSGYRRTRTSHRYTPVVKYTYTVNELEYRGDTIAFGMGSYGNKNEASAVSRKYPSGSTVTVYYNPASPATSVLQPGNMVPGLLICAGGLFILALGIIAPFFLPDKPRPSAAKSSEPQEGSGGGEGFSF